MYFSEELKLAKSLGYTIIPLIKGYLFEKLKSPFVKFFNTMYGKRQEAKNQGNKTLFYVSKILMNSLYGRFGMEEIH